MMKTSKGDDLLPVTVCLPSKLGTAQPVQPSLYQIIGFRCQDSTRFVQSACDGLETFQCHYTVTGSKTLPLKVFNIEMQHPNLRETELFSAL